jgi:osmoprotectant transport system permease protein
MSLADRLAAAGLTLVVAAGHATVPWAADAQPVRVGSKKFTESVILGEALVHLCREAGVSAVHQRELGGTRILWSALLAGEIDVYPEYTGTLREEILAGDDLTDDEALRAALAETGVGMSASLGFNDTYALGMARERAAELRVETISQLRSHPGLRLGFSNELMDRADGWPSLRQRYALPHADVRGIDHDLALRGLAAGHLDVTDLYSTDAEIRHHDLLVLRDDLGHFPRYDAVLVWRLDLPSRHPGANPAMRRLEGRISEADMIGMNAAARIDRVPETEVAARFVSERLGLRATARGETVGRRLARHGREHLALTGVSLGAAVLVAVPVGVLAARRRRVGQAMLAVVGILQTIPSLALLVGLIPLLGIGAPPAIAALFLYSLLPIVRNTHAGLTGIAPGLRESADALGLEPWTKLLRVELPLALPSILAGVQTSAVINVGTATLGALVGAGGYGQPILTGIRLDDTGLILQGAVPAAVLAIAAQGLFAGIERLAVPRGLRGS